MALPLVLTRRSFDRVLLTGFLLSGLVISLSRSAWLGGLAALAILLFIFRHKILSHRTKIVVGLLSMAIFGLMFPQARGRLKVLMAVHEYSNAGRIEGWKSGIKVWRHYPYLGTGPDTFFRSRFRPYRNKAIYRFRRSEVSPKRMRITK